jgi:hypothetical protein
MDVRRNASQFMVVTSRCAGHDHVVFHRFNRCDLRETKTITELGLRIRPDE